jgi:Flp pilus assembly pilin Flp
MDRINLFLIRLRNRKQEGQAMVEYGLILGLVSVVGIAALTAINTPLGDMWTTVQNAVTDGATAVG